jgi:hypothetical protein
VPNAPRIELPRPAIIAALGALILAVTFVVTHGSTTGTGTSSSSSTSSSSTTTSTTTTPTTTTTTKKPPKPAVPALQPGPGLPSSVARALNADKVVVLFFFEPAGADDQATRAALRAVRAAGGAQVALFSNTVSRISNYRRLVGSLGISQSPAMVVIDKKRRARLFEGYLDAGTIEQSVRDAL